MAKIRFYKPEESTAQIGANSAVFANGDLVALSGGFLIKAIDTTVRPLVGVANATKTMASDNQTVGKVRVPYTRIEPHDTRFDFVTSADITQADVGKFYGLTSAGLVDVSTANAAIQSGSVVRLEGFKAARLGTFIAVV